MTRQDKRSIMLALVDQWKQSGLSQAEFSRLQDINILRLRYWIKKQRQSNFSDSGFIQLNPITSSGINIRYPNGVELILPSMVPAEYIKILINL